MKNFTLLWLIDFYLHILIKYYLFYYLSKIVISYKLGDNALPNIDIVA